MLVVVGRVGRAHGLRGEVAVEIRTDAPDERFAAGTTLRTESHGPLTMDACRPHRDGLLVHFVGVDDRDAANALRGTDLLVDTDELPAIGATDEFYDHQLVGLRAELTDGTEIGAVADVLHTQSADLLVIRRTDGRESLVPFVHAVVPTIDLDGGRVIVDPPAGLLEL